MVDSVHTLLLFETLFLLGCLGMIGRLLVKQAPIPTRSSLNSQSPNSSSLNSQSSENSDVAADPDLVSTLKTEVQALRQEGLRLRDQLATQQQSLTIEMQRQTFQTLQTLLTNYPSLRPMVQAKPELPARNIVALLTPLDNLLLQWDITAIGTAWEPVAFDPQLHQADQPDIQPGETVYVRFVGYQLGETILCPAKVSRTLPGGGT